MWTRISTWKLTNGRSLSLPLIYELWVTSVTWVSVHSRTGKSRRIWTSPKFSKISKLEFHKKIQVGNWWTHNKTDLATRSSNTTTNRPQSKPRIPFESPFSVLQAGGLSFLHLCPSRNLKGSSETGSVAVLETSPTRKTLPQQPANRSEIQWHHSKALTMHYSRVNCCFGILILKENNQQWARMGKFAISNANAQYTTTSQPFEYPMAPFESAYYAL